MKKILLALFVLVYSVGGLIVKAQIYEVDGIYYRLIQDSDSNDDSDIIASVTSLGETDYYQGRISIPSSVKIEGKLYSVGAISDMAFKCCKKMTSIIISSNVKSIPSGAFYGCNNLTSIVVDPDNPFYDSRDNCNAIIETSKNNLIAGCSNTIVPASVTSIGECAFYGCSSLTSLSVPFSVKKVGDWAFLDCENIGTLKWNSVYDFATLAKVGGLSPKAIVLGDSVYAIKQFAFAMCSELQSLFVSKSVTEIDPSAFYGCEKLSSIVVDQENTIYDSRYNCNAIVETKTNSLVVGCKNTVFPSSVTSIGDQAFAGCLGLTSVEIPSHVVSIGDSAFADCINLTSIQMPSTSVDSIGTGVFESCVSLKSIIIPEGVQMIGNRAFKECSSLSYILIPKTVVRIGTDVFSGCCGLKTAGPNGGGYNYEFSWNVIPANAFTGLSNLESVYIPKTVNAIYESPSSAVFKGCSNLKSVTVSFKDTKLYRYNNNTGYYRESDMNYNLYITNPVCKLTVLDDTIMSFNNILTGGIKELVISKDVKVIAPDAFAYNTYYISDYREVNRSIPLHPNLENITVESGNRHFSSINGVLFNKNENEILAYPVGRKGGYRIPTQVTAVGSYSFNNCDGLSNIIVTKDVKYIGERAFESCDSLVEVTIEGLPEIGLNAFSNCNNIQGIWTRSAIPGKMNIFDSPQPIITGDYNCITIDDAQLTPIYDKELARDITEISTRGYYLGWTCNIMSPEISEGNYKISIGILPSPEGLPNYFHPVIYGINDTASVVLYESIDTVIVQYRPGGKYRTMLTPTYLTNDITGYDRIVLADTLTLPTGYNKIAVAIESGLNDLNREKYSTDMYFDRIFLEPLDNDLPAETYAGTFTANVFNNATLYVPEGSANVYQTANGWKLFKKIAINTAVNPVRQDNNKGFYNGVIYDLYGRKVAADSIDQLQPGLYIINGKKYLKM